MNSIEILNTGFTLCLAIGILFLIISIVLFFVFDIRTIFSIRTGRAQAKTVKEMQTANANTGRLRAGKQTQTGKLSKNSTTVRTASVVAPPAAQQSRDITEQLDADRGIAETEVLDTQDGHGTDETQVLKTQEFDAETSVLGSNSAYSTASTESENVTAIYFEVIKKVVCRDTDEVVR
ncbi:MAG: hypothetical protein IJA62_04020 [Ruminococcus sp.]|nr:hypothetical protein [Ruminococcus sp.]